MSGEDYQEGRSVTFDQQTIVNQEDYGVVQYVFKEDYQNEHSSTNEYARHPLDTVQEEIMNKNNIKILSCSARNHMYGLSHGLEIYKLTHNYNGTIGQEHVPSGGILFKDISVARDGTLFAVGQDDSLLYKYSGEQQFSLVVDDIVELKSISALSKRKIYAIGQDNTVLFLKIKRIGKSKFENLGAKLKCVSAGGKRLGQTEIWGIGINDNEAYRYYNGQWVSYQARLIAISVADDNAVYGISMDGKLVKWSGDQLFTIYHENGNNELRLNSVAAYKDKVGVVAIHQVTKKVIKIEFSLNFNYNTGRKQLLLLYRPV
ncbi:hypothetical protein AKO1_003909 [Acrasis kona]|uniref:Uncharacterized protein n=1 Tax=Acrasis kona TaxID=1008807 RepID=A0AAW2ZKS0_9EUKA